MSPPTTLLRLTGGRAALVRTDEGQRTTLILNDLLGDGLLAHIDPDAVAPHLWRCCMLAPDLIVGRHSVAVH